MATSNLPFDPGVIIEEVVNHQNFVMRYSYQDKKVEDKDTEAQKALLQVQLYRDPGIFMERYGHLISKPFISLLQKHFPQDTLLNHYATLIFEKYNNENADDKDQNKVLEYSGSKIANHINLVSASSMSCNPRKIRNRRYQAMKQLEVETDYFSLEQMRIRQPELFNEYILKYRKAIPFEKNMKLSERLLYNYDLHESLKEELNKQEQKLAKPGNNQNKGECKNGNDIVSDGEESELEDSEDEEDLEKDISHDLSAKGTHPYSNNIEQVSEEERNEMEKDFIEMMKLKFLHGEDGNWFDYSNVDQNDSYDDLDEISRDAEETYFSPSNPIGDEFGS